MIRRRYFQLLLPLALAMLAGCQDRELPTGIAPPSGPDLLLVSSPNVFTQVSAGYWHTCALRSDGAVDCWGAELPSLDYGQAPDGKSAANGGSFTAVSAGGYHSCALRSDRVVECWGDNFFQQAPASRSAADGGSFTQVSAGYWHTCALRSDGAVECWGDNYHGQAPAARSSSTGNAFTQVSVGDFHSCALRSDGVVECWGRNEEGQAPERRAAATGSFTQVSAGGNHSCALRSDGAMQCWGDNSQRQAGSGSSPTESAYTEVSAGGFHTCTRLIDSFQHTRWVECYGSNDYGQAPFSKSATAGVSFVQLSAGLYHTCVLRSDGAAECWGYNLAGQAPASRSATPYTTTILPTATFSAPASVVVGHPIYLALDSARVPGWPGPVSFTYAFDCGNGYFPFDASHTADCPTGGTGTRTVGGKVRDHHGHETEYRAVVEVTPPDNTPPIITPIISGTLGRNGWYTSDATVYWSVTDPESAIVWEAGCSEATGNAPIITDTPGNTQTCKATSLGGTASQSVTIKRDATAPSVNVTGVSDGATYILGSVPAAGCSTTDALSGVATNATASVNGTVGAVTATCSGAMDNAGNTAASVSVTYTVTVPPSVLIIDANGTLNKQTGAATISGTANCSTLTSLTVSVSLSQSQSKGKTTTAVSGSGSSTITCNGSTVWSVTVTPSSPAGGKFSAGAASASASAPGATSVNRTVQLK